MSSCVNSSRSPGGDLHLGAHDVDARDDLGDRVLHLDARVHLHEVVGAVGREQSLDRPGGAIPGGARRVDRDLPDPASELRSDGGRRRLLDELLMAALDRAVPLAEVDDVAVSVGEHLHLDVSRILEVPLDVDRRVGEIRPALALRGLERLHRLVGRPHDLHALAAAAGGRLDDQRIADLRSPSAATSSADPTGSVVPGMIGTPASCMAWRARVFEPISSIAAGGGPIQTSPAASTARANAAFSARNP